MSSAPLFLLVIARSCLGPGLGGILTRPPPLRATRCALACACACACACALHPRLPSPSPPLLRRALPSHILVYDSTYAREGVKPLMDRAGFSLAAAFFNAHFSGDSDDPVVHRHVLLLERKLSTTSLGGAFVDPPTPLPLARALRAEADRIS